MADDASMPARVIIADDHPLYRSALTRIFEEHSEFEVVSQAADGREVLEFCRRLRPELVLMDLGMPDIDGLEATRTIKRELPRTIVVVLTAYEDPDRLSEALKAGASGYLLKNAPPQQIIDALRKALEGEIMLDQGLAKELLLLRLSDQNPESSQEPPPAVSIPEAPPTELRTEHPMPAPPRSELTPREVEVLRLLSEGRTNQQIARELLVSTSTVKNHIQQILTKLRASDRTQAAVIAIELGLLSRP
jgi:DNA-binding NarL/FixJ family response regulator